MSSVPDVDDWRPYSERNNRGPRSIPLPFETLVRLLTNLWEDFSERDYFQESIGFYCVDSDAPNRWEPGYVGSDFSAYVFRQLDREISWPPRQNPKAWDIDSILDFAELMYRLCAKPLEGGGSFYHDFSRCGWHYASFDRAAGQLEYREALNRVLRRCDPPLAMDSRGQIVEEGAPEYVPLLTATYPAGTEQAEVIDRVEEAKRRFQLRGSSETDRRFAVTELSHVIEYLSKAPGQIMPSKDEAALGQIANKFALRHHNRSQQAEYDTAIWHRWMFYVYLATIHAALRTRERDLKATGSS